MLEGHLTYGELAFFLDFFRVFLKILEGAGGSFSGRTTGSGPVNLGSNPSPPAIFLSNVVPSSSGLGYRPLTPKTRVRVPLGPPLLKIFSHIDFSQKIEPQSR